MAGVPGDPRSHASAASRTDLARKQELAATCVRLSLALMTDDKTAGALAKGF